MLDGTFAAKVIHKVRADIFIGMRLDFEQKITNNDFAKCYTMNYAIKNSLRR